MALAKVLFKHLLFANATSGFSHSNCCGNYNGKLQKIA